MGLDRAYQALPVDCELIQRARRDPAFGCKLEFFHSWLYHPDPQRASRYADDPTYTAFMAAAQRVIEQHPGIEQRYVDLDRRYDMLYYVLSPWRRSGTGKPPDDWVKQGLYGGDPLHPETVTTIGSPICYLTPERVFEVAAEMEAVDLATFAEHWNPAKMHARSVYKISPNADPDLLTWIVNDFVRLKELYTQAALHGEGMLTWMS